jgi:H+-transporting ATPase
MWRSKSSVWVVAELAVDIGIVSTLALSAVLMAPASWRLVTMVFLAAIGFALLLDQIKRPVMAALKVE